MLWACVHLPHLAIDSVLRRHPDADRPLVLVTGGQNRREIATVNRAAHDAGLRPGQRLAAAQALLADFTVVDYNESEVARCQEFLAAWAYRYSSEVVGGWPGCIVFEAERSFAIFGRWEKFQARLREDLVELGYRHRIALAPTPRAARVLAGVCDGLAVEDRDALSGVLGRVPVTRGHLPEDVGDRLHQMGLRHLRQVFALPRDAMRRRFGADLLDHLDRMLGRAPDLLEHYQPPDRFDMRVELSYEVENHFALMFPVRRMTADLATYLAGRDGGVQDFVLQLEHEDKPPTDLTVGLLAAERDPGMLFELTRGRLEQAKVPAPVVALRLIAQHLPPFVPDPSVLNRYRTLFIDSITVAGRLCFQWCKGQPQAFSEKSNKPDIRGAYGLLGQEMVAWLTHIQHTRNKHVWFVGILDERTDEFNRRYYELQIDGSKTGLELPGIVDEVITLAEIKPADGEPYRAFVCQTGNPWGFPAKDRSGRLEMVEPPDLGRLMRKLGAPEAAASNDTLPH